MLPKISQKPLFDATPAEVRMYATQFLGLDTEPSDSESEIMSKVMTAQGWSGDGTEMIFLMEAPEAFDQTGAPPPFVPGASRPAAVAPQGAMQGSLGHDDPKVTIQISNENRNGEVYARDVEVGVNGRCWQLRRNVPITIPYRVYLALKEAVEDSVTHVREGSDMIEVHTEVQRVPFSVTALPTAAEVAAWHERVDNIELA